MMNFEFKIGIEMVNPMAIFCQLKVEFFSHFMLLSTVEYKIENRFCLFNFQLSRNWEFLFFKFFFMSSAKMFLKSNILFFSTWTGAHSFLLAKQFLLKLFSLLKTFLEKSLKWNYIFIYFLQTKKKKVSITQIAFFVCVHLQTLT